MQYLFNFLFNPAFIGSAAEIGKIYIKLNINSWDKCSDFELLKGYGLISPGNYIKIFFLNLFKFYYKAFGFIITYR